MPDVFTVFLNKDMMKFHAKHPPPPPPPPQSAYIKKMYRLPEVSNSYTGREILSGYYFLTNFY